MSSSIAIRFASRAFSIPARQPRLVPAKYLRATSTSATQEKDPQLADYPELWQSSQALPPRGWWDQSMRRNFGDPVRAPCGS